jgi:hypothetical protein
MTKVMKLQSDHLIFLISQYIYSIYIYIWESPWGNHLDPETTTTHSNIADSLTSESWVDLLIRSFQ